MDNRRFTALMLTMVVMFLWITYVIPWMFPGWGQPKPQGQQQAQNGADPDAGEPGDEEDAEVDDQDADDPPAEVGPPPNHPRREIVLGSDDPDSKYYMQVVATTEGASLRTAAFNDPNFVTIDRTGPLHLINPVVDEQRKAEYRTLTIAIPEIDAPLSDHDTTLATLDWEVVPGSESESSVAFQVEYGGFRVTKTFTLNEGDDEKRETDATGYFVNVDLEIVNLSDADQEIDYTWHGPVGLPQESAPNLRTVQEVKVGVLEDHSDGDDITLVARNAQMIVDQFEEAREQGDPNAVDTWRDPLVYAGVDVQYFAALMVPNHEDLLEDIDGDGKPDTTWQHARPRLVEENRRRGMESEISVLVLSRPIELDNAGGDDNTHQSSFRLYLGPKRENILDQFHAGQVITYGWFASVSRVMLTVLNFFHHSLGLPYALAIVLLTVCVKTLVLPLSFKTAEVQRKQKELTPELNQIKEKFKNEPEKFLKAQRELFHKHGHRPFVYGCLPALLMLPIYIGLFYGLDKAFDLRLAQFLWIDNLAAPDALFKMPFPIFWFGSDFNLLPVLTVALMIIQQKYFMPPPATEEAAMQMKFMQYAMVAIGLMFWHVAAGLCLYFITQNLWSMGERKLLERLRPSAKKNESSEPITTTAAVVKRAAPDSEKPSNGTPSFWQRLQAAADQARQQSSVNSDGNTRTTTSRSERRSKKRR